MFMQYMAKTNSNIQSQVASLRTLETQIGQLANAFTNCPQGVVKSWKYPPKQAKNPSKQVEGEIVNEKKKDQALKEKGHSHPPLLFPQRFQKPKLDIQFKKFLEVLKKLHINIPFSKALEQMPTYVKFMKDILSKKQRIEYNETVKTLCDLGASINLMHYSIFHKLGLKKGKIKLTKVTLQFAYRSQTYPRGIIEDVLVKVDKLIFPADFLILDMEEDKEIRIILGRLFIATSRTLIDVQKGELTMRV
ncbi:DNA-directed DNA polymerase [Quillaja saponaria]|uniref:DNA-directed DNA polymerase n=1 Tax=Quillaja saponaria TaxID=32244 RepID=A0AAD7VHU3_QUISA|nr:DNA-directed DNA polymerase [Quillaja saponaria]